MMTQRGLTASQPWMRADTHRGPEHNRSTSEAEYIDAALTFALSQLHLAPHGRAIHMAPLGRPAFGVRGPLRARLCCRTHRWRALARFGYQSEELCLLCRRLRGDRRQAPWAYATQAIGAPGGGRSTYLASFLKFWAVATSKTSSRAPLKPLSRSRSSFRMRFMCANSISTCLRSRRDCWKASVLARARTRSRTASSMSRVTLRTGPVVHWGFSEQ